MAHTRAFRVHRRARCSTVEEDEDDGVLDANVEDACSRWVLGDASPITNRKNKRTSNDNIFGYITRYP